MQHVRLGRTGLQVSRICLGTMTFGLQIDEPSSRAVLDRAADLGVTFLDTADAYGPYTNERLIGAAVKGRRDDVQLATKFGNEIVDGTRTGKVNGRPDYVRASVDGSLQRLGVDVIDLYYQHRVDPNVPIEDVAGAVKELIRGSKKGWKHWLRNLLAA